ncbi:MAG: 2-hydroxychromene-2-carboxylate isomerase [Myxococcales bacterium]|nr:2-hydroxychromene-2-carboxylate isomerase [Myxococcales bacterium]
MITVEFWFDFSCPYAYLASRAIEAVCARPGVRLELAPMLLGGVFRSIGAGDGPMPTLAPAKALANARDMARWAERRGVPLHVPPRHPQRTVRALRTMLALPPATWPAAMHALYAAYWVDGVDVTDAAALGGALTGAGLDADVVAAALIAADSDARKDELRARTDRAVALGIFGAPAMVVRRGDAPPILLWGQDRLHWLTAVLDGWAPDGGPPPRQVPADPASAAPPAAAAPALDFWFDYSSPFAYLGATQIERVAAAAGATVRYRPMLLGALFRELGTADVPLLQMPEPKRRYVARELDRWARWWGVDFRFSSRFPLRTVAPLRLTLLAGDRTPALVARLFRAAWVEDRDVGGADELRALAAEVGLDPALVDRTSEPAVKQALIASTAAATAAGVFGAPTTIVHSAAGPLAFWGQDRLDLVAAALRGWIPEAR